MYFAKCGYVLGLSIQSNRKTSGFRIPEELENNIHQLPVQYLTLPTIYATLREPSNHLSTTFNLPVCCRLSTTPSRAPQQRLESDPDRDEQTS
ncbi:hypothetical protein CROQUDRAFT_98485 [Cronartium quercuum f. sp. fusiforme G11]|uniref:Uncharacterized protein n=1 Tax=Cronartium quercuum f. sp. fusiforme G11 TaxID=708437 RepID=A0A9P6NCL5_9BASI|nr:hypothetical protein CROQUDRAFT_98485 [Cronartium quercuum f. sp. fusiforme G11]